jgi:hypothetical protein
MMRDRDTCSRMPLVARLALAPVRQPELAHASFDDFRVIRDILAGMPVTGLRDAILTHPTMAEGLNTLFSNVPARADT